MVFVFSRETGLCFGVYRSIDDFCLDASIGSDDFDPDMWDVIPAASVRGDHAVEILRCLIEGSVSGYCVCRHANPTEGFRIVTDLDDAHDIVRHDPSLLFVWV